MKSDFEKKQELKNKKLSYVKRAPEWEALCVRGDITMIAEKYGVSKVLIGRMVKEGKGSLRLLSAIDAFFRKRERSIKK